MEQIKKHQRPLLVGLIVICMGIIVAGGLRYIRNLQDNLTDSAIHDVMNVTIQQRQALDGVIAGDRERLHSFAHYFSRSAESSPEMVQERLSMFDDVDAIYLVMCLEDGWICGTSFDDVRRLDEEDLAMYRSLGGSGVRSSYIGLYSGTMRFGYYETFTFGNGHEGLIQKSYDTNKILETFSLSMYNGEGYGCILDEDGDILIRSVFRDEDHSYSNVFNALADNHSAQEDIDALASAMANRETGSLMVDNEAGRFVYTYMPMESVEGWYMLSIVPTDTIREAADQMLRDSQTTLELLVLVLVVCAVLVVLIWRTYRDMAAKEQEAAYQTQLFQVFGTYLGENTDDVYMVLDHETERLEYVSPNVERVLGVPPADVIRFLGEGDIAADPEGAADYYAEVNALLPGQAAEIRSTERVNPKTGERKFLVENAYCADIQGRCKRVCYISDRTADRAIQSSLTEALQMARAANDAKSAFLSNISHDIRTPMNAIIGFLSIMRDEVEDPDMMMEYIGRIDAASQHLLGLINDVLDMNKIESGSATLNITELNLAEVIDEINTIIRPQAKDKKQNFEIFVSHLNYEHLLGDKLRLNQVLINLLSNAVKYTPEGGNIQMSVAELPQVVDNYSRVRFTIADNGVGMSEEYQKVIFDPFTREETKDTYGIQGTGLGMAITKSLVDLMGGTIQVKSTSGHGSTFTVELELCIQEREDDPKFWEDHGITRVIVTDDEEEVCRNIVKTMAKTGVVTDYATDGETALRMMREAREAGRPYDLILLDWKMPKQNGLETARLIRRDYSEKIPILLLTAYDWGEIEKEAIEIGVNHFMSKPFFMSTFKAAIRRVMDGQRGAEDDQSDVVLGRHVLVVDDIEVNRIILVKILTTLGADCDTASNGQEAVDKFCASQPGEYDLILMDVQMPVLGGYEATRAIRDSGHPEAETVPIVAMTANAFVDDVRDALEAGMDAHIAKPVQMDKLKATIRQVLDEKKKAGPRAR